MTGGLFERSVWALTSVGFGAAAVSLHRMTEGHSFSSFIRARRLERGLSVVAAASRAQMSPTTWRSAEAGAMLRGQTVARIAEALRLNVDDVLHLYDSLKNAPAPTASVEVSHVLQPAPATGKVCYYCGGDVPTTGLTLRRLDGAQTRLRTLEVEGEDNYVRHSVMNEDGTAPQYFFCSVQCLAGRIGAVLAVRTSEHAGRLFDVAITEIPADEAANVAPGQHRPPLTRDY